MAEDPNVHPHWAAETKQVARDLNRLDYFQVLGVAHTATFEELKAKYPKRQNDRKYPMNLGKETSKKQTEDNR